MILGLLCDNSLSPYWTFVQMLGICDVYVNSFIVDKGPLVKTSPLQDQGSSLISIGIHQYDLRFLIWGSLLPTSPLVLWIRATSHTSQEPWPWNCESPKESVQRPSHHTSKIMLGDHKSSSVVWSHMYLGPQPNAISMNFYPCRSSHIIKYNKSTDVGIWSTMVSRFCVKPTSERWF